MEKITITEALSEVNLIKKKIIAKQARIQSAVVRAEHNPDPFLSDGGSSAMVKAESQGIHDLNRRLSKIRSEISRANLGNEITLGEDTRSIHDWLVWKREIAKDQIKFTYDVHRAVKAHLDMTAKQPQVYKDADGNNQLVKWTINVDYAYWLKQNEQLEEKLEQLDGKLSLKNATIVVNI